MAAVTSDSFSALFFIFPPAANIFAIAALLLERCQEKVRGVFPLLFAQWCFKPHFKVYQKHTTIQTQPKLRFVATERQSCMFWACGRKRTNAGSWRICKLHLKMCHISVFSPSCRVCCPPPTLIVYTSQIWRCSCCFLPLSFYDVSLQSQQVTATALSTPSALCETQELLYELENVSTACIVHLCKQ